MTQLVAVLRQFGEHHDDDTALFPDHLPEVGHGVGHWALGDDVGRVPGVVVHHRGGVDVVRVGAVDQSIQDHSVVIVGQLVRVAVLLLVLHLHRHSQR